MIEIGNLGTTGNKRTELLDGVNFQGAAFERALMVLFSSTGSAASTGEVSLPDLGCESLIIIGLQPDSVYELNFGGLNVSPAAVLPGVSAGTLRVRTTSKGVVRVERQNLGNLRLRISRV
ncbi:MAG: hypothetical protein ACRD3W_26195 [Terriglobales bacterium]